VVIDDASNWYIRGDGPLVAVTGVDNLIVVATDDVVLVTRKGKDQNVKALVDRLKSANRSAAIASKRVHRPCGYYDASNMGTVIRANRSLSIPLASCPFRCMHYHRAEHWVVVNGTALVTRDEQKILLHENESFYLLLGTVHRLENPGKLPLNLIEVQSGAYLGEDDIVRIEDIYERV
jgi:mannose-6-phosphate isomerase-like protein (cupin superfamily)